MSLANNSLFDGESCNEREIVWIRDLMNERLDEWDLDEWEFNEWVV